uniref:Cupin domain-containing protein n=1 Tax=Candidatus Kentrum sp. FW TaxID=2126338 RepID=A0A450T6M0_9GAMM|nr:MAG: hypothetical protein BECKFW1821A_GA0114235_11274 [Candidatus Kentron sp. FW]
MPGSITHYTRIYVDDDGQSHFENVAVTLNSMDYAPPASPLEVSDTINAHRFVFVGGPPGWVGDWHPSPRRQFVFVLSGLFEVGVGDGETRHFGPGAIMLLEGTTGRGHFTKVISDESGLTAMVHLE